MRGSRLPQKILMEIAVRRFPKRFEGFSPPLLKQLLKNCRPCSVQNQENSQQMLFLSQSEKFMAFFWQPPSCVGGIHTAFLQGWPELEGVLWGRTHSSPVRQQNWPCFSTLPTNQHTQHCSAGALRNAHLFYGKPCCQSKLKQSFWWNNDNAWCCAPRTHFMSFLSTKVLPDLCSIAVGVQIFRHKYGLDLSTWVMAG